MKKLIALLLALVMVFALVACASETKPDTSADTSTETDTTTDTTDTADAADAEHRDPRMVQALHRLGAKLGLRACKLVNHRPCLPLFFPCAL